MLGLSRIQQRRMHSRRNRPARLHGRPEGTAETSQHHQLPSGTLVQATDPTTQEDEAEGQISCKSCLGIEQGYGEDVRPAKPPPMVYESTWQEGGSFPVITNACLPTAEGVV
jgi:hypothetical protein